MSSTTDAVSPKQRLNQAQHECYEAEELVDRARDGLADITEDDAMLILRKKTMRYLRELHRFQGEKKAYDLWRETILEREDGSDLSLKTVHESRFRDEDTLAGGEVQTVRAQALSVHDLKQIVDQADGVYHALGLDIEIANERPYENWGEDSEYGDS